MRSLLPILALSALAPGACAARQVPQSAVSVPSADPAPPPADEAGPLHRRLARSAVRAAVAQGLGAFLQHVDLDGAPVRVAGKFHGFRIVALHDAQFWSGVDLKPGDVVTQVNGFPIERPEQAQTAFESLQVAKELRVSYERDGEARELVLPIDDR